MSRHGDNRLVVLSLRAVAALAEKLADDLENGRLWPGEYSQAMAEIQRNMSAAGRSDMR